MEARNQAGLFGDWPTSAGPTEPTRYKVVSVRLRQAEFAGFSEQVRKLGLTNNLALRIVARRIAGFLEVDGGTRQVLRQISADIGEISASLSALQRNAERLGSAEIGTLFEIHAAFGSEFAVLDDKLQALLNISQRRIDGLSLLKNALGK